MRTAIRTKAQLCTALDRFFLHADSSWDFLHSLIKTFIETNDGTWEDVYELTVPITTLTRFDNDPEVLLTVLKKVYKYIGLQIRQTTVRSTAEDLSIMLTFYAETARS